MLFYTQIAFHIYLKSNQTAYYINSIQFQLKTHLKTTVQRRYAYRLLQTVLKTLVSFPVSHYLVTKPERLAQNFKMGRRIYPCLYRTFEIYSRRLNLTTITTSLKAQILLITMDNISILAIIKQTYPMQYCLLHTVNESFISIVKINFIKIINIKMKINQSHITANSINLTMV